MRISLFGLIGLALLSASCDETFSAGRNRPRGLLPVDQRNPIILINDSAKENWQGEYAMLLANSGGPKLVAIIVGTSPPWPDSAANIERWRKMVKAARDSGMRDIPDPVTSTGPPLVRPASGAIDETQPNRSEGARAIVEESKRLSLPYRPLVVVVGTRLTDVADAYLMDETVTERVVVVASVGEVATSGGTMERPNGEMDPWADSIVTSQFRYIQVSARYNSRDDVPDALLAELPSTNSFVDFIKEKRPDVWDLPQAADQVGPAAVGIPDFVTEVEQVAPERLVAAGATVGPRLLRDPTGKSLLVRQISAAAANERFRQMLLDPRTFGADR